MNSCFRDLFEEKKRQEKRKETVEETEQEKRQDAVFGKKYETCTESDGYFFKGI